MAMINVDLDDDVRRALKVFASRTGRTMRHVVVTAIEKEIGYKEGLREDARRINAAFEAMNAETASKEAAPVQQSDENATEEKPKPLVGATF